LRTRLSRALSVELSLRRLDDYDFETAFRFEDEMLNRLNWLMKLLLGREKGAGFLIVRGDICRSPSSLQELRKSGGDNGKMR
jgi:hypothetical protein